MSGDEGSSGRHEAMKAAAMDADRTADDLGMRILLVEDDPDSQELIRTLCEARGASVDTVADGFHGLRLLSERRHDVVLIDYHLPEMDGYALARLMRELARPKGRVRLVGVTADRRGLASRRGADTLFDAILVKPLEPAALFAILDRLTVEQPPAADHGPADALWRRRGLAGRPRALYVPEPTSAETEAVGHAFALVSSEAEAEVVLVGHDSGLARLRTLRGEGPAALLPSIDLTGRLGAVCDVSFQVSDPDSWSAMAQACRGFTLRRALLPPVLPADPALRLLALLFVADHALPLGTNGAPESARYETGQSEPARTACLLALAQKGLVACESVGGGVAVRVTEAGRGLVTLGTAANRTPSPPEDQTRTMPGWRRPAVTEAAASPEAEGDDAPVVDSTRLHDLRSFFDCERIERMQARLGEQLETALPADADLRTLSSQAHILISTAGSLGFERLSQACRALQAAIETGTDVLPSLDRARRAAAQVLILCRTQAA